MSAWMNVSWSTFSCSAFWGLGFERCSMSLQRQAFVRPWQAVSQGIQCGSTSKSLLTQRWKSVSVSQACLHWRGLLLCRSGCRGRRTSFEPCAQWYDLLAVSCGHQYLWSAFVIMFLLSSATSRSARAYIRKSCQGIQCGDLRFKAPVKQSQKFQHPDTLVTLKIDIVGHRDGTWWRKALNQVSSGSPHRQRTNGTAVCPAGRLVWKNKHANFVNIPQATRSTNQETDTSHQHTLPQVVCKTLFCSQISPRSCGHYIPVSRTDRLSPLQRSQ